MVLLYKKSTEQYFPVVLFIIHSMFFLLLSMWMKSSSVTIQMKASEQYFPLVLFITLNKLFVDEILLY